MSTKRPPPTDGRAATSHPNSVTLICFGAPHMLVERFQREARHDTWKQVVDNPFQLWVVVLNELFKQMDAQVWNLADAFRGVEKASDPTAIVYKLFPRRYLHFICTDRRLITLTGDFKFCNKHRIKY